MVLDPQDLSNNFVPDHPSGGAQEPPDLTDITLEEAPRPLAPIQDSRHYCTSLNFPLSARMLGVLDHPWSFWLPDHAHRSFFAPGQGYSVETKTRALPCYIPPRLVHFYFSTLLLYFLYCISIKGDSLILPHARTSL